jgi:hypothetical protein
MPSEAPPPERCCLGPTQPSLLQALFDEACRARGISTQTAEANEIAQRPIALYLRGIKDRNILRIIVAATDRIAS